MRIAVQMDPIERSYPGETTHYIAREAGRRGHELYYYTPADLFYRTPSVMATARRLSYTEAASRDTHGYRLGDVEVVDLSTMDVVLLRQDPPFDLRYLATTYLLERIHPKTLVVNDPSAVRDTAEKLSIVHLPDLAPPTLITSNPQLVREFHAAHGEMVIKHLFGHGGDGIFFVGQRDKNFNVILETLLPPGSPPVMVQKFIADTSKKVVIVDGEPVGAMEVILPVDDIRGNLDRGEAVHRSELTREESATVAKVARFLGDRGILFASIDLVGPYLIESNVTSPGALYHFEPLYGVRLETPIVEAIERRRAAGLR